LFEDVFENNFDISENNIIGVKAAKVVGDCWKVEFISTFAD
jgi:hypothetical protein